MDNTTAPPWNMTVDARREKSLRGLALRPFSSWTLPYQWQQPCLPFDMGVRDFSGGRMSRSHCGSSPWPELLTWRGGGRCLGSSFSRCWILFEPFTNILSVTNSNGCTWRTLKNVVASGKLKRNADKIIHTSSNDALFAVGHWNPSAWSIRSMHRS